MSSHHLVTTRCVSPIQRIVPRRLRRTMEAQLSLSPKTSDKRSCSQSTVLSKFKRRNPTAARLRTSAPSFRTRRFQERSMLRASLLEKTRIETLWALMAPSPRGKTRRVMSQLTVKGTSRARTTMSLIMARPRWSSSSSVRGRSSWTCLQVPSLKTSTATRASPCP